MILINFLEALEICVIQFANTDIDRNFEKVCSAINGKIKALLIDVKINPRRCAPLLRGGEFALRTS